MIAPVPAVSHTTSRAQPRGRPFLQIDDVCKSFARGSTISEVLSRIDLRIWGLVGGCCFRCSA